VSKDLAQALDLFGLDNLDNQTEKTLKKLYHKLAFISHPDRGGDSQDFIEIRRAYSTLKEVLETRYFEGEKNKQGGCIDYKEAYKKSNKIVKKYQEIFNNQIKVINNSSYRINQIIKEYDQDKLSLEMWLEENQEKIKSKYKPVWWKEFLPGRKITPEEYHYYNSELINLYNEKVREIDDKFISQIINGYKGGFNEIINLLDDF